MRQTKRLASHRSKGFTIVELLVVIAVIGILATVGLVSWNGVQSRAKRNGYQSTSEQVKMKLGEYFTEKSRYFGTKAEVVTYLNDIGSASLSTEFAKTAYNYNPSPLGCTTACTSYTIMVPKSNWNGAFLDPDVTVMP